MPDHGKRAPVDPTSVSGNNQLCDENDDDDELMRDITQEFEFEGEGPPIHPKLHKILQGLIWGIFKKEKIESVIEENLPPKNLEPTKVNLEVWNKISYKTKSIDIRQEHIQSYILKALIVTTKNVYKIFQAKKNK